MSCRSRRMLSTKKALYFSAFWLPVVLALPQGSQPALLPPRLASILPPCGQTCISTKIAAAWPSFVCSSAADLDCLCRSQSRLGLALGEIALACLVSACPASAGSDAAARAKIWGVCDGVSGALPRTHTALTVTVSSERPSPTTPTSANSTKAGQSAGTTSVSGLGTRSTQAGPVVTTVSPSTSSSTSSSGSAQETLSPPTTASSSDAQITGSTSRSAEAANSSSERSTCRKNTCILLATIIPITVLAVVVLLLSLRFYHRRRKARGGASGFRAVPSPSPEPDGARLEQAEHGSSPAAAYASTSNVEGAIQHRHQTPKRPARETEASTQPIGIAFSSERDARPEQNWVEPAPLQSNLARQQATPPPPPPPLRSPLRQTAGQGRFTGVQGNATPHSGASPAASSSNPSWVGSPQLGADEHLRGYHYAMLLLPPLSIPAPARANESSAPHPQPDGVEVAGSSQPLAGQTLPDATAATAAPGRKRRSPSPTTPAKRTRRISTSPQKAARGSTTRVCRCRGKTDRSYYGTDDGQPERLLSPLHELSGEDSNSNYSVRNSSRSSRSSHSRSSSASSSSGGGGGGGGARPCKALYKPGLSPISPERLRYPAVPPTLSMPVRLRVNTAVGGGGGGLGPQRPLPLPPPLLRNDTYSRSEDLVVATTQALAQATGSPQHWTQRNLLAEAGDSELRQLRLTDEVASARQGLELMRERAARAAANISASYERGGLGVGNSGGGGGGGVAGVGVVVGAGNGDGNSNSNGSEGGGGVFFVNGPDAGAGNADLDGDESHIYRPAVVGLPRPPRNLERPPIWLPPTPTMAAAAAAERGELYVVVD